MAGDPQRLPQFNTGIDLLMQFASDFLQDRLEQWRIQIDQALGHDLNGCAVGPRQLLQATQFSLMGPAKRLRALLVLASAHDLGTEPAAVLRAACAIEMIHSASLILDDLPCMDDATRRRDRDTTHRAFGEETAILAAIGLISRAYEVLGSDERLTPETRASMIEKLAVAMGFAGLTGGQYDDLMAPSNLGEFEDLNDRYQRKTGVLFGLALRFGACGTDLGCDQLKALTSAGQRIGVAFQIYDDLVDVCASPSCAGKDVKQDNGKATAASVLGKNGALTQAGTEVSEAITEITGVLGEGATAGLVRWMAEHAVTRTGISTALASAS